MYHLRGAGSAAAPEAGMKAAVARVALRARKWRRDFMVMAVVATVESVVGIQPGGGTSFREVRWRVEAWSVGGGAGYVTEAG